MTSTFLVAIDGSDSSHNALVWASRLAAATGATIRPAMAWHYPAAAVSGMALAMPIAPAVEMHAETEARLAELVQQWEPDCAPGTVFAPGEVLQGPAGPVLCSLAEEADLLVVGSRGLGGFKGLLLGSVGAHCAHESPVPVAIIPATWDPNAAATNAAVVGVDGSDNAHGAIAWADRWLPEDTVLTLLHLWEYPDAYRASMVVVEPMVFEEAGEQILAQAATEVARHQVELLFEHGDARHHLAERAASADLLVLGTRGAGPITRLLVGSVASSVVHHIAGPTVLVPPT